MALTNKLGRVFNYGSPISDDSRLLIVNKIEKAGGNKQTMDVPRGVFTKLENETTVTRQSIKKIWEQYCITGTVKPSVGRRQLGTGRKLTDDDVLLIKEYKEEQPSITYKEIRTKLIHDSVNPNVASVSDNLLSKTVRKRMPDGPMSRKKTTLINNRRFTPDNMDYTQIYMDYVWDKNPLKLKFMDESGVEESAGQRTYGHGWVGKRAYEVTKFNKRTSKTVNLLVGLEVKFCNVLDGASNTDTYIDFILEALDTYQNGIPVLDSGDLLIVDNCKIHHHEAEEVLTDYLRRLGIEYLFLPAYSPDFNPCEKCFNEIKMKFKTERFQPHMKRNVGVAVYDAIEEISYTNIVQFYRETQCINMDY